MIGIIQYKSLQCEPLSYNIYPWNEKFPYINTTQDIESSDHWSQFYNNPSYDGVSFNLNLGGYRQAWVGLNGGNLGVWTEIMDKGYDTGTEMVVSGGVIYDEGDVLGSGIDFWRYDSSFIIDNPIAYSRYSIVGGEENGLSNPPPGHHVYEGVASAGFYNGYIQAKNHGKPFLYETWFSLTQFRSDLLRGYNNYTFFGDNRNYLLNIGVNEQGYIKKYYCGIFKAETDMENPNTSDFICGVSYDGDEFGGFLRIIVNGEILREVNRPNKAQLIVSGFDEDFNGQYEAFDSFNMYFKTIDISTYNSLVDDEVSTFMDFDWPIKYPPEDHLAEPYSQEGMFNTHLVKYANYCDYNNGMGDFGALDWERPLFFAQPAMYTHPYDFLLCSPLSLLPNYVPQPPQGPIYEIYDSFVTANGRIEGGLVNSDSESSLHLTQEGYSWNVGFWQYFGDGNYPSGLTICGHGNIVHQTDDIKEESDPLNYINSEYLDAWCLHEMSTFNYFVEIVIKCPPKPTPPNDFNNNYYSVTLYGRIQTAPDPDYGANDSKFVTCELGMNDDVNNLQLPFGNGTGSTPESELYPVGLIIPYVEGYRLFRAEFEDQMCRIYVDGTLYHTITTLDPTHTNNGYVGFGLSREQLTLPSIEVVEFRAGVL